MDTISNISAGKRTFIGTAFSIWLLTSLFLALAVMTYCLLVSEIFEFLFIVAFFIAALFCSVPALILIILIAPVINKTTLPPLQKKDRLVGLQFFISLLYGIVCGPVIHFLFPGLIYGNPGVFILVIGATILLFLCSLLAFLFNGKKIAVFFFSPEQYQSNSTTFRHLFKLNKKITIMAPSATETVQPATSTSTSTRILIKGVITGLLILLLLIPAFYITNLVTERQERQKKVVEEVSSKWATAQTLSGPYLVIPYTNIYTNDTGKIISTKTNLVMFADNLNVNGELLSEKRQRSIYKVLLYRSALSISGSFKPEWPVNINTANIDFSGARLCFGLSDFKGLEEEIKISLNNQSFVLSPGLPITDISETGLSVPVVLQNEMMTTGIPFNMTLKLRGSERLHFLPLAANSRFELKSAWPNPSFDGNVLPNNRTISDKGFTAAWNFNRANLPFNMLLKQGNFKAGDLSFGVSMVQPADQYEKTMRSVKYAVLFIGLTFAFFFIIELLEKRPFHPVQYVLVGLGLLIFYTLLLSISEFILFDYAYVMAAGATIALISLYAKSHFTKWRITAVFAAALSCLYGFIFVLIRLEDTALLIGSIGLFIILSITMYLSRRIKWYGHSNQEA